MTSTQIDEIRTVIENDLKWRQSELSFLNSLLNFIEGKSADEIENKKRIIRKNIVLSMYAHFEGYFRFAFETYAYTLNEAKIEMEKVIDVLYVSSLSHEFSSYDESNKWITPDGENELNQKIKRLLNRLELLNKVIAKGGRLFELSISNSRDKKSALSTESNLSPNVIDKILYGLGIHRTLGLGETEYMKLMGLVSEFVKKRNGIAHGDNKSEFRDGLSHRDLANFETMFNKIVLLLAPIITKSLTEKLYLKVEHR